ncbi:MAG: TIGR02302 family protein, partial [Pseudomonadota bacterium]
MGNKRLVNAAIGAILLIMKSTKKAENIAGLKQPRFWTRGVILAEGLLPKLLPTVIVLAIFAMASWLGWFRSVPDWARLASLAVFAMAGAGSLAFLRGLKVPTDQQVDARIERENELLHRPITAQDDALADDRDPMARALWQLHKKRMAERIGGVSASTPQTDLPKRDPFALRSLVAMGFVTAFAFSFGPSGGTLTDAFRSHVVVEVPEVRVDAWITPPSYTGIAPIFLTSGINVERRDFTVPEGSVLQVRVAGGTGSESVYFPSAEQSIEPTGSDANASTPRSFEMELVGDSNLIIRTADGDEVWQIAMIADLAPTIRFADENPVERAVNGALTLRYHLQDDYRINSARGVVELLDQAAGEKDPLPLYDAPELPLVLPRRSAEDGAAATTRDLASHPWAGARVKLTLEATDDRNQIGRSASREIQLPGRPFANPLARAIIEQRRILAMNAHEKRSIIETFDTLMLYPDETIDNATHFLGLQTIETRLAMARDEEQLRGVVDY